MFKRFAAGVLVVAVAGCGQPVGPHSCKICRELALAASADSPGNVAIVADLRDRLRKQVVDEITLRQSNPDYREEFRITDAYHFDCPGCQAEAESRRLVDGVLRKLAEPD